LAIFRCFFTVKISLSYIHMFIRREGSGPAGLPRRVEEV
jgi:hypothetical protein